MGRPRQHNEATRDALLEAAERLAAEGGLDAVGVRSAAAAAGTTTRAVYSVFGSKEELVQGLAGRAYELLMQRVAAVPWSEDPIQNLVEAGVKGFRRFAIDHPQLFRLFFLGNARAWPLSESSEATRQETYGQLLTLITTAEHAGWGRGYLTEELAVIWDAACCGLALREVCGALNMDHAERIWRDSLGALAVGLGAHRD